MYKLIRNFFIAVVCCFSVSCEEDCMNMQLINETTEVMASWYTDEAILSKIATSNIGVSDEVMLAHEFFNYGDTIWDDCDNASESSRSTVTYSFFNFPYTIITEFNKQGEEDGFKFTLRYNDYVAFYRFTSQTTSSNNTIELLSNFELNEMVYDEIFKINFNQSQNDNDIKTVYYIKALGVIQIELYNEIIIDLNN